MILWLWTNVTVWEVQLVGNEGTLCDGTGSNASYCLCLWELSVYKMYKLVLYERAYLWVCESLAVVSVDW